MGHAEHRLITLTSVGPPPSNSLGDGGYSEVRTYPCGLLSFDFLFLCYPLFDIDVILSVVVAVHLGNVLTIVRP